MRAGSEAGVAWPASGACVGALHGRRAGPALAQPASEASVDGEGGQRRHRHDNADGERGQAISSVAGERA
jgi:hypothetical protein